MRKILFFSLVTCYFCFTSMDANAQIKVEPYLGLTYPVRNIDASEVKEIAGLNAGIEVRKDLYSLPISVGADLFVASSARQKEKLDGEHSSNSQRMAGIAAVCDYYFLQGEAVSSFVGSGIGLVQRHTIMSGIDNGIGVCSEYGPVISPRVGIELWNHLRITAEARFTQRDYNVFAFRIGYVFGKASM